MAQNDPAFLELNQGPLGRAERLRQSADEAARVARTLFITFLVIGLYIAITIAGTTDVQLLKDAPVQLPLLDIRLPIVGFYAVVPWLLVLVHLNLLLQLYLLGRKLHAFNEAVEPLDRVARLEQQQRLYPFPLSHMLAGKQHNLLVRVLLAALVWITVVILPLVLLIWGEVRFLPYRDAMVTWLQRMAVGVDVIGLWLFCPLIVFRSIGSHPLLGVWTRVRTALRWVRPRARLRRGTLKRWRRIYTPRNKTRTSRGLAITTLAVLGLYGLLVTGMGAEREFRRTLDLREAILVRGDPPAEVVAALRDGSDDERDRALKRVIGLSLVDRDLRGAELGNALLPKADLRDAWLDGANLSGARLENADLRFAKLIGADLSASHSEGVDFRYFRLGEMAASVMFEYREDADTFRAQLVEAQPRATQLIGSNLYHAWLIGADLRGARLDGADLRFARLMDADLRGARLEDADLGLARLARADLRGAQLIGADLSGALLRGADLRNAFLQDVRTGCLGPRCINLNLTQADLRGAKLTGVDLREAKLEGANLEGACGTNVRLPEGYSVPPCGEADTAPPSSAPSPEASPYAPRITVQQD